MIDDFFNFLSKVTPEEIINWLNVLTPFLGVGVIFKTLWKFSIEGSIPDNLYVYKTYDQLYKHAHHKRYMDWIRLTLTHWAICVAALMSETDAEYTWLNIAGLFLLVALIVYSMLAAIVFAFKLPYIKKKAVFSYNQYIRKNDGRLFMTLSFALILTEFVGVQNKDLISELSFQNIVMIALILVIFPLIEILLFAVFVDRYSEFSHIAKGYFVENTENSSKRRYIFFLEKNDEKDELVCGDIADANYITTLLHRDAAMAKQQPTYIVPQEIYDQIIVYHDIKREENKLGGEAANISSEDTGTKYLLLKVRSDKSSRIVREYKKDPSKTAHKPVIFRNNNELLEQSSTLLNQQINKTLNDDTLKKNKNSNAEIHQIMEKMLHEVLSADEKALLNTYYYNLVMNITDPQPESKDSSGAQSA